jgi:site-specific DNA-methyltransferase (adenine-specific)
MDAYIRVYILDPIFGSNNFRNEIVWCYKRWTAGKEIPKVHDTIYRYSKTDNYTHNQVIKANIQPSSSQYVSAKDKDGKTIVKKDENGNPMKRRVSEFIQEGDWWEIPILSPVAKERCGYPTQKPEALLERIIKASSNEGGYE